MTDAPRVRSSMGLLQLQFFEFSADRTHYRYTHAPQMHKVFGEKWAPYLAQTPGQRYLAVMTYAKPAISRTATSYDIVAVAGYFPDKEALSHANRTYWSRLKAAKGDLEKLKVTRDFLPWLKAYCPDWSRLDDCIDFLNGFYNEAAALAAPDIDTTNGLLEF